MGNGVINNEMNNLISNEKNRKEKKERLLFVPQAHTVSIVPSVPAQVNRADMRVYIWTVECIYGLYSAGKNSSPSPRGLCGQGRPPKTQDPTPPALHIEHSLLFRFFIKPFLSPPA